MAGRKVKRYSYNLHHISVETLWQPLFSFPTNSITLTYKKWPHLSYFSTLRDGQETSALCSAESVLEVVPVRYRGVAKTLCQTIPKYPAKQHTSPTDLTSQNYGFYPRTLTATPKPYNPPQISCQNSSSPIQGVLSRAYHKPSFHFSLLRTRL